MALHLLDDGTLDTVLTCSVCGETLRYSEADREPDGSVSEAWIAEEEEEHADTCLPPDDDDDDDGPPTVPYTREWTMEEIRRLAD